MLKEFLKKWMPTAHSLKTNKYLKVFGPLLHLDYLWHFNRHTVSRACSVGLFCAFLPMPFQMVFAAAGAIAFRTNIAIAIPLVWITNPLTIPPIFYFAYKVGLWIMQKPAGVFSIQLSWQWLSEQAGQIWQPLLIGSLACGISTAILGYWLVRLTWYYWLVWKWHERKNKT